MRLLVGQTTYEGSDTVSSAVGVIVGSGNAAIALKPRIDPMAPDNTKLPETDGGVADVTAWFQFNCARTLASSPDVQACVKLDRAWPAPSKFARARFDSSGAHRACEMSWLR